MTPLQVSAWAGVGRANRNRNRHGSALAVVVPTAPPLREALRVRVLCACYWRVLCAGHERGPHLAGREFQAEGRARHAAKLCQGEALALHSGEHSAWVRAGEVVVVVVVASEGACKEEEQV